MDEFQRALLKEKIDRERSRRAILFHQCAKLNSQAFHGIDSSELVIEFEKLWEAFQERLVQSENIKDGSRARQQMLELGIRAEELARLILDLDQGAVELMNLSDIPVDLLEHAKAFDLPNHGNCFRIELTHTVQEFHTREMEKAAGGLWVIRLKALAKLAHLQAGYLGELIAKGGRKSLSTRLHGSSDEWLADTCWEFSRTYGVTDEATVLRIVRTILQASDHANIKAHAGRKAVRKVAQTRRNSGPV
jgi:hypothetical protein